MAMPYPHKIKKTMIKQGIAQEIIDRFDFPDSLSIHNTIALIDQMDRLLTKEQRLRIMEEQGCVKTGKMNVTSLAFGGKYADKTLEEKIALLDSADIAYRGPCRLNDDGTFSVFGYEHDGVYTCGCHEIMKLPEQPTNVSVTYCGCCAGLWRHMYQNALGVKLQLIEVTSSALSTNGAKRCEFLFEIL
jgi:hypothetical protein